MAEKSRAERDIRLAVRDNPDLRGKAEIAVAAIERDICDRRGLKSIWGDIDPDIVEEIKAYWTEIIETSFKVRRTPK